ncbi:MAG TPA: hypothetical protein DCE44_22630 [Verrucomicrobiales bacterium]|nr:hypothetical protein [Verrucomicrobiales bacterium]
MKLIDTSARVNQIRRRGNPAVKESCDPARSGRWPASWLTVPAVQVKCSQRETSSLPPVPVTTASNSSTPTRILMHSQSCDGNLAADRSRAHQVESEGRVGAGVELFTRTLELNRAARSLRALFLPRGKT